MDIDRLKTLAGTNEAENNAHTDAIVRRVRSEFDQRENLARDIDNIRVVDGNIMYTYNGIMDCAILFKNGLFGDIGDTSESEVAGSDWNNRKDVRWFPTLDKLLDTINAEADPDR